MTTKIQNIAMFAVAAFALSGMMVAPAFADDQWTLNYVNDTATGTSATSAVDNDNCGSLATTCGTKTTVDNANPTDKVTVHYKVVVATCTVNIDFYKNNVKQGSTLVYTNISTGPGNYLTAAKTFSISATDDIRTETQFTSCTWP
ncbi:MAG: hypothetical protein V3W20_08555 [Candidatus Neomarinimicrobiota bacterium]